MNGAHKRTLEKALSVVVKKERLAAALDVAGGKPLPHKVFLTALDIVATGTQE